MNQMSSVPSTDSSKHINTTQYDCALLPAQCHIILTTDATQQLHLRACELYCLHSPTTCLTAHVLTLTRGNMAAKSTLMIMLRRREETYAITNPKKVGHCFLPRPWLPSQVHFGHGQIRLLSDGHIIIIIGWRVLDRT